MSDLALFAFDIVAITVLAYGVYFRRHRRRDMLLAYAGLNIGVMAVSLVLVNNAAGLGLGLGLFGVLSIIRLRSSELSQEEVAYYFVALALGLLAGSSPTRRGSPRCSAPCWWRRCTWPTTHGCSPATAGRSSRSTPPTPTRGS